MTLNDSDIIHLLNRFGFGADADSVINYSAVRFQEQLFPKKVAELNWTHDMGALKAQSIQNMVLSENAPYEKLVLFWHHYFACIIDKSKHAILFSEVIRKHAFGNFRDLLLDVSKSAAMLHFLNGKKNKAGSPNENFARELCEIYTLGEGNGYSERDVKEIARCFTGWKYDDTGTFYLREKQFDSGTKTVFGKSGRYTGEDVVELILSKPECANYLAEKIYTFFVNDRLSKKHVFEIRDCLMRTNYDLQETFAYIISVPWFYSDQNKMALIKSPIELIVGLGRSFRLKAAKENNWFFVQKLLNHEFYKPKNVKGWPTGREWIDSSSLTLRMHLPQLIFGTNDIDFEVEPDLDQSPGSNKFVYLKDRLKFKADWNYFLDSSKKISPEKLWFNNKASDVANSIIKGHKGAISKEYVLDLLSLPEYQMH